MKDLIIYGAGGFGRETALMVEQINEDKKHWNVLGFIDDNLGKKEVVDGLEVLGGMQELKNFHSNVSLVVAMADPLSRKAIITQVSAFNLAFPALIHPDAKTGSAQNKIGQGCIITAGCIFTTGISLEDFVIVNLLTSIGHDVMLRKYSSVMPGCNISGNVEIGECTLIGTGAQILQNIRIGSNCRVGAGAVVTRDITDSLTVIGIPAKRMNR